MNALRKLFTNETDTKVNAILDDAQKDFKSTAVVAKKHRDLLRQNGVTLQIFIATGGDRRVH